MFKEYSFPVDVTEIVPDFAVSNIVIPIRLQFEESADEGKVPELYERDDIAKYRGEMVLRKALEFDVFDPWCAASNNEALKSNSSLMSFFSMFTVISPGKIAEKLP